MAAKKKYDDETEAANLATALKDLPDEWVICRDMRHAWRVAIDFHVTEGTRRVVREVQRVLVCDRCVTQRKEIYNLSEYGLEKASQHYVYPDHYQLKGVPRGVKPSHIVQGEQYRRAMLRATAAKKAGSPLRVAT